MLQFRQYTGRVLSRFLKSTKYLITINYKSIFDIRHTIHERRVLKLSNINRIAHHRDNIIIKSTLDMKSIYFTTDISYY